MGEKHHKRAIEQSIWYSSLSCKASQGSASVEYSVITEILIAALFLPMPGLDDSLVSTLVTALKQFQSNSTFLMSMP